MRVIIFIFEKWWRPVIYLLIAVVIGGIGELFKNKVVTDIDFTIYMCAVILVYISAIIQFFRQKWLHGIVSVLIVFTMQVLVYCLSL